jgi:hypothetical protein
VLTNILNLYVIKKECIMNTGDLLSMLEEYIKSRERFQARADKAQDMERKAFYESIIRDKQKNIDRIKEHLRTGRGKAGRRSSV